MASKNVVYVTDADFEEKVLKAEVPVILDLWAEWCGPCRMIGPVLEELADDYEGKAIVAKLNVDDSPNTAAKYSVRSIPTVILFNNGEEVNREVGAGPKAKYESLLKGAL